MTTPQPTTPQSASEQRVCPFPGEVYTLSVDDRPVFPTSDQTELDEADKADFASELDADLQNVYNNVMDDFFYDRRLRASTWAPIAILPNPKLYNTVFDLCSGSRTEPITHEEHISLLRTARRFHDAVSRALGYVRWQKQQRQARILAQTAASGSTCSSSASASQVAPSSPPLAAASHADTAAVTVSNSVVSQLAPGDLRYMADCSDRLHKQTRMSMNNPFEAPGPYVSVGHCAAKERERSRQSATDSMANTRF